MAEPRAGRTFRWDAPASAGTPPRVWAGIAIAWVVAKRGFGAASDDALAELRASLEGERRARESLAREVDALRVSGAR